MARKDDAVEAWARAGVRVGGAEGKPRGSAVSKRLVLAQRAIGPRQKPSLGIGEDVVVQDEAAEVADRLSGFEEGGQRGRRVDGNREDRDPDKSGAGVRLRFEEAVGGDLDRKRATVNDGSR
jgi:hypothetical protein